jgi:predicted TIM-barrel fold metal-dependent hydrolase
MRGGFRVYDSDTHISPSAETLEKHFSAKLRARAAELESAKVPQMIHDGSMKYPEPYPKRFRFGQRGGGWRADPPRRLGEAEARPPASGLTVGKLMSKTPPRLYTDDWDFAGRLQDMDAEGVDVALLVNPGGPSGHPDRDVNVEFMRAQHRHVDAYCSTDPRRLKSLISVNALYIDESVEEIRRWGDARWVAGVYISLPLDYPLDHPDLHPIWKAANEKNLCFVHHSFSEGYPGYRDLWRNPFIGRTASHPWGAMRAMSSFFGAGLFDRYPNLRFAILECGFGWIPFWAVRMEDQAEYMGFVAENLQHSMVEYASGGRFFASAVLHEGGRMVKMVSDYLGEQLLMFGSDYPHPESRFPGSVDVALGWKELDEGLMRKLLWDNAVRAFGEP